MCGICGVFNLNGRTDLTPRSLERMADTIAHRGPDDSGTYVSADRRAGLGFRRLSIIDLSAAGHQPMSNEDGTLWLVFNGEIYNHNDLRKELEAKGHIYCSLTDSETILHGYEQWGPAVVDRLRGMFAFAIYDQDKSTLFLARDHLGIKPLYYTSSHGCFLFGSEIKALLAWPGVVRAVDDEALFHYLALAVAPAPQTLFRDIHKLLPGHTLTIQANGQTTLQQYWDPLFPDEQLDDMPEREIVEQLRSKLRESIRLRMMSDVPFGVFLSGGVDSSLNVALMREQMDRPVETFSVAIDNDPRSNELSQARRVARYFGTNHHEVVISTEDFVQFLPEMVHYQDEPLADPACIPLYFVSRLARENGTTVIQVGEGSDELFSGYTEYAVMADFYRRVWQPFARLPRQLKKAISVLGTMILPDRRAEFIRRAADDEEFFWSGASILPEVTKRRLLRRYTGASSYQAVAEHYAKFDLARPGADFLNRIIYVELKYRLAELLLMRVDKMSMATSIETRVPFLDHELVRFALSIPASLKYRGGQTKYILKAAARGIVPDEVIDRPKQGFCGSASNMLTGVLLDYTEKTVLNSTWLADVLKLSEVQPLFQAHRSGRQDAGAILWTLLNLVLWHRHWIEQESFPG